MLHFNYRTAFFTIILLTALLTSTAQQKKHTPISQPLITSIYTADPAAHVFNGKIYIYNSHDIDAGIPENGDHFVMKDYHVLSMDSIGGNVTDNGIALDTKNIAWAGRQLWAPDAAYKNGTYYLYFPLKDTNDIFRIGVATSKKPAGPFKAEAQPIEGSYSTDPCVFKDKEGSYYLYFGGIWGGQLQRWTNGVYDSATAVRRPDELAVLPRIAKLSADMKSFAEPVKEVEILDENGKPFYEASNDKRFFEGAWMHHYKGKYYFSYSTGDTHNICYAMGDNPYGPFTYKGIILKPVEGWTSHVSIVEIKGKWYLFYHDAQLSGKTYLRNVKVTELKYRKDGSIIPIDAYK
jgi:hypothetical protein